MTVAMLRAILEHLPDDLTVHVAGRGELTSVRRQRGAWVGAGVYLDVRGPLLRGVFIDIRTLKVRLHALGAGT